MKKVVILITCLLLGASLNADTVKGPYIGVGYGGTNFDDGGHADDLNTYAINNAITTRVSLNTNSTGYKIYGGYQFNKIIALEASYTKYGKFSRDYTTGNKAIINPYVLSLSANLGYNLGRNNELRPFAKLGVASFNADESGDVNAYVDDTITTFHYGFGVDYNPEFLKGFGFRMAYEADMFSAKSSNTAPEFKSHYTQYAGIYYFGVHYKF